ncbi:MAG: hypothetical protein R3D67_18030 [Hyphomicrobiaceae bacterium]
MSRETRRFWITWVQALMALSDCAVEHSTISTGTGGTVAEGGAAGFASVGAGAGAAGVAAAAGVAGGVCWPCWVPAGGNTTGAVDAAGVAF